jgi:hypothetical protein
MDCNEFRWFVTLTNEEMQRERIDSETADELLQHDLKCNECQQWSKNSGRVRCFFKEYQKDELIIFARKEWMTLGAEKTQKIIEHLDGCGECDQFVKLRKSLSDPFAANRRFERMFPGIKRKDISEI